MSTFADSRGLGFVSSLEKLSGLKIVEFVRAHILEEKTLAQTSIKIR